MFAIKKLNRATGIELCFFGQVCCYRFPEDVALFSYIDSKTT